MCGTLYNAGSGFGPVGKLNPYPTSRTVLHPFTPSPAKAADRYIVGDEEASNTASNYDDNNYTTNNNPGDLNTPNTALAEESGYRNNPHDDSSNIGDDDGGLNLQDLEQTPLRAGSGSSTPLRSETRAPASQRKKGHRILKPKLASPRPRWKI